MSKVWTTIKVANIAFVIHLVLVVVGQTVKTASTGSLCEDPIRTPCVKDTPTFRLPGSVVPAASR